ncbi:MAG: hypothetical protein QM451_03195 [Bacillota bacterium]|jgi:hypothetical protein|nr:hypothetical protein [Bacillota bacterium]HHT91005.1 hypothetical protein [Bacillota bacterium]
MRRYNRAVVERRWRTSFRIQCCEEQQQRACTGLIPKESGGLDLENARLLVLTDFFAMSLFKKKSPIAVRGAQASWMEEVDRLGLIAEEASVSREYALAVIPRDYPALLRPLRATSVLSSGRLLHAGPMGDVLPDFGGDALRIYFLYMGPPTRDYKFCWHGLVSAHRFAERIWRLGSSSHDHVLDQEMARQLATLEHQIALAVNQIKPHTALAAIMKYIKDRHQLVKGEVWTIAQLLRPFAPFLSAELLRLVASVQDQNGGQGDDADA